MSGLVGSVLLRKPFELCDTGRMTGILKAIADEVQDSRKGKHWDFVLEKAACTLDIVPTADHWYEYEDCIAKLNLSPDEAPEAIVAAFALRRECDRVAWDNLRARLLTEFHAIDCGNHY